MKHTPKLMARACRSALVCTAIAGFGAAAFAQNPATTDAESSNAAGLDSEIVVTARKRSETALTVPVAITAIGKSDLEKYATDGLIGLSSRVPGLVISPAGGGGTIALRGVSSGAQNPSIDQAVSINVDGLQIGSVFILRLAQIDLQQIEVLKGPQALFFGKNSPGGVVSLRTADPASDFEVSGTISHEFEASESTGQLVLSGPITDTLGGRIVFYGSDIKGYIKHREDTIPGVALGRVYKTTPNQSQFFTRATLLFKPTAAFSIRAKYSYSALSGSNPFADMERVCVGPTAQHLGLPLAPDDCRINGVSRSFAAFNPDLVADGPGLNLVQKQKSRQTLASVEVNYEIAPDITLTSLTGYYKNTDEYATDLSFTSANLFIGAPAYRRKEFTEELRIATSRADWPVNFTAGLFYQDGTLFNDNRRLIDSYIFTQMLPLGVSILNFNGRSFQNFDTKSAFGQAIWKIVDRVELAGGARYTEETKDVAFTLNGVAQALPVSKRKFTNTSPEATLSWRPTRDLTFFAGWRNGFKSGGFNTANFAGGSDVSYRPEKVSGFDVGMKTVMGDVRANLTAYNFKYKDLQLTTFDPSTISQNLLNAGAARVKGLEFEGGWRPSDVRGLDLHVTANYNDAKYIRFLATCYTGQTIAARCSVGVPVAGAFQQQDMAGRRLSFAPKWTANIGLSYEQPLGSELKMSFTADGNYSSGYFAHLEEAPAGFQRSFWKFDASVRIGQEDGRWEFALIGLNLTQRWRATFINQIPFTGIASRTGTSITGGLSDLFGTPGRGRQIRAQLSFKI